MARFLIATTPSTGHVEPALIVAKALLAAGHEVGWYTGQRFQARIEAAGVRYFPIIHTLDYDDRDLDAYFPRRKGLKGLANIKHDIKHVFIDAGPGQLKDLTEIQKQFRADVILADFTFVGAGWFAEKGGPVWATLGHTPLSISSRDTAPFGLAMRPNHSRLGRWRNRGLNLLLTKVLFREVIEYTDDTRASVGLPAKRQNPVDTQLSPYLWLQGTVAEFEYPRSDLPPQVHFVGPFLPHPPADFREPKWWRDLKAGRPVVHITQGTIQTDPQELIIPTVEALAHEDVLVVATTGGKPAQSVKLESVPANVRLESFIPHYSLLPHVDLMITNGGYNAVQLALANGVPLIVNGHTEDKPEVANRVEWAGAGLNLKTKKLMPEQLRQAVKTVLGQSAYKQKACELQAHFARFDAAKNCVRLLELLAETQKPVVILTAENMSI